MERQKWVAHTFQFGIDPGWGFNMLNQIRDTKIRLEYHCKQWTEDQLSLSLENGWSIKEHVGHLIDLEALHTLRLHELGALVPELSAADMSNAKTEAAKHNETSMPQLLSTFGQARNLLINTYKALSKESLSHQALHPRLKVPMRPLDVLFFAAEHDNHHLTSICELVAHLKNP